MKKFKSSDLSHKRAEVMKAAEEYGAVIQEQRTNGEVKREFVLITKEAFVVIDDGFNGEEPRVYPENF